MKYRLEIDGLRAVAVLPVILFHAGVPALAGGFIGVDVFFVISGYLITALLLRDLDADDFSFVRFYERRARRLLPALFVVLLASLVVALIVMPPLEFKDFGQSLVATGIFGSNILFWLESGYFETAGEMKPLLHTWSLAVEEQYYLLFPPLLWGLWRWWKPAILPCLALIFLVSLALADWGSRIMPDAAFYLTPFRIWELLAGALLAWVLQGRTLRGRDLPAALGLGAILAAMVLFDDTTRTPSLVTLLPVLGTCAVLAFATPETWVGRILTARPLVWVGLISYSAYLWHQPLFAFARLQSVYPPSLGLMLGLSVLALGLAWVTWLWIERPFRRPGGPAGLAFLGQGYGGAGGYGVLQGHGAIQGVALLRVPAQATVLEMSAVGLLVVVTLGAWGHVTNGRAALWQMTLSPETRALHATIHKEQNLHQTQADRPITRASCIFSNKLLNEAMRARLDDCAKRYGPGVMILGDSHAIDAFLMVTANRPEEERFVVGLASGGCRPHEGGAPAPECAYEDLVAFVKTRPDVLRRIVFTQAGFYLMKQSDGSAVNRASFAVPLHEALPKMIPAHDRIGQVLDYLDRIALHVPVTWLGPRLEPHIPLKLLARHGCGAPVTLRPGQREAFDLLDQHLARVSAQHRIGYLSMQGRLDLAFPEDLLNCPDVFWSDGDHFSAAGEERFGARLNLFEHL